MGMSCHCPFLHKRPSTPEAGQAWQDMSFIFSPWSLKASHFLIYWLVGWFQTFRNYKKMFIFFSKISKYLLLKLTSLFIISHPILFLKSNQPNKFVGGHQFLVFCTLTAYISRAFVVSVLVIKPELRKTLIFSNSFILPITEMNNYSKFLCNTNNFQSKFHQTFYSSCWAVSDRLEM